MEKRAHVQEMQTAFYSSCRQSVAPDLTQQIAIAPD